ncbi:hypothetical protein EBESD8_28040 [Rhodococcus aetherivorans]|nr:hypothetical protein EBESD8_28040 [Rhodococcus aetherivorans]
MPSAANTATAVAPAVGSAGSDPDTAIAHLGCFRPDRSPTRGGPAAAAVVPPR